MALPGVTGGQGTLGFDSFSHSALLPGSRPLRAHSTRKKIKYRWDWGCQGTDGHGSGCGFWSQRVTPEHAFPVDLGQVHFPLGASISPSIKRRRRILRSLAAPLYPLRLYFLRSYARADVWSPADPGGSAPPRPGQFLQWHRLALTLCHLLSQALTCRSTAIFPQSPQCQFPDNCP